MVEKSKNTQQTNNMTIIWMVRWIIVNVVAYSAILLGALYAYENYYGLWGIPNDLLAAVWLSLAGTLIGGLQSLELPFPTYRWRWFRRSAIFTLVIFSPAILCDLFLPIDALSVALYAIGLLVLLVYFPIYQFNTLPNDWTDMIKWNGAYWAMPVGFWLFPFVAGWVIALVEQVGYYQWDNMIPYLFIVVIIAPVCLFGVLTAYVLRGIDADENSQKAKR